MKELRQLKDRLLATTEQDYGWVVKVQDRVYGRRNELIYRRLDFTGVFPGTFWSLRVFLGVVSTLPTTTDDAIPLPVRWSYLLYCLDDRAHRRHIHSIPPQYKAYNLF